MKPKSVLLMKVGNSQISFCRGPRVSDVQHLPATLTSLRKLSSSSSTPKFWYVASVNRQLNTEMRALASKRGIRIHWVEASDLELSQPYRQGLGIDRLLNVFVGTHLTSKSFMVIDLGTATTVEFYCRRRGYLGGWIASGVQTSLKGLALQTSALPDLPFPRSKVRGALKPGRSTKECLLKGVEASTLGLMEFARRRAPEILESKTFDIMLTGGWSAQFRAALTFKFHYEPHLLLKALGSLAERRYTNGE